MCLVASARGTQNAPHGTRFRNAVGTRSYLQFWGLCKCNLHFRRMKFALEWLSKWLVGSYLHVQHLWHCKLEVFERIGGLHTHSIHVHIACSMFGFWENAIWMFVRSRLRTHRPNEPNAPQEATKIMYIYCIYACVCVCQYVSHTVNVLYVGIICLFRERDISNMWQHCFEDAPGHVMLWKVTAKRNMVVATRKHDLT